MVEDGAPVDGWFAMREEQRQVKAMISSNESSSSQKAPLWETHPLSVAIGSLFVGIGVAVAAFLYLSSVGDDVDARQSMRDAYQRKCKASKSESRTCCDVCGKPAIKDVSYLEIEHELKLVGGTRAKSDSIALCVRHAGMDLRKMVDRRDKRLEAWTRTTMDKVEDYLPFVLLSCLALALFILFVLGVKKSIAS
jgi:hypothetical protein